MSSEKNKAPKLGNQEGCKNSSLLDLPVGTLDCILELLSPHDLCTMARVCTFLKHKCRSDDLWEKQVKGKWGSVLGDVAYQEWQRHTTKIEREINSPLLRQIQSGGSWGTCSGVWPFLRFHSYLDNFRDIANLFKTNCSKFALFICLESGRFWFPAQVYQTVKLYCYDAIVSYDSRTDTFRARSPTGGWRMIEGSIQLDRLRLSLLETYPIGFYVSSCLQDLKPGDYIEIQKRRRKELPYDWWLAVVGHLESCDQDANHCHCQYNDMLVVEFKQFSQRSRWRRSELNRNVYEEQGSRGCWFGGIKKLEKEEIERWSSIISVGSNAYY